jgi:hypothetical protein
MNETVYIPVTYNGKTDMILGVYNNIVDAQIVCMGEELGDDLEMYIYEWSVGEEYYDSVFDFEKDTGEWIQKKV